MSVLDIKININHLLEYSGSLNSSIDKKTMTLMIRSFSEYILRLYKRMITEAIYSNRYKGNWEPTSDPEYLEYIGTDPVPDILSVIQDSLEVKKIGYNFVVRFNPRYKYPGSKLPIERVLRAIDKGTSRFHARPIFNKIIKDISSRMFDLWRGYLVMRRVI